jgi:hypothetical protein
MASIYSNAYVTIAAAEGEDSGYGLPGINKERLRETPFVEFSFSSNCHYISANPVLSRSSQRHIMPVAGLSKSGHSRAER